MVTAESIKSQIESGMPCDLVHVEGDDGYHFNAIIVSAEFRGKEYGAAAPDGLWRPWRQDETGNPCPVHENAHPGTVGSEQSGLMPTCWTSRKQNSL